jgi:hypothetical protein
MTFPAELHSPRVPQNREQKKLKTKCEVNPERVGVALAVRVPPASAVSRDACVDGQTIGPPFYDPPPFLAHTKLGHVLNWIPLSQHIEI